MKTSLNSRPVASVLLAAAFAFGLAGTATAQQQNPAGGTAGGTVGGSTADMTSAGNTNMVGMPQTEQQGDVSFVSGGVGLDESHALRSAAHDWPLSMRFTARSGQYLADVHVRISNAHGSDVLDTTSRGPYMLVRVPPGRYTIHVDHGGVPQTRAVTVGGRGSARASFTWQT